MSDPRRLLLRVYRAALDAVDGRRCVRQALASHVCADDLHVVAIGKAAESMMHGAFDACGDSIARGLLITKHGHVDRAAWRASPLQVIEAGHPVPDARSLDAGAALLAYIDAVPADGKLLFLLSGGASSLVEVLADGAQLADLQRLNRYLLGSGLDIHAVNRIRKACSRIKGGRLARYLSGRTADVLLISDVEGDDPSVIGSGLLVSAIADSPGPVELPAELEHLAAVEPAPSADDPCFRRITIDIVATNRQALDAAAAKAAALGAAVHRHPEFLKGEAATLGERIAETLLTAAEGVHLWGGEPTVTLPPNPGKGGRMQSLALAAATVLAGRDDVYMLAAGSDGSDGPSEDAGAVVDGATAQRCRDGGYDPADAVAAADAGSALAASGDLVHTGPTGTNVMDVVVGLRLPRRR